MSPYQHKRGFAHLHLFEYFLPYAQFQWSQRDELSDSSTQVMQSAIWYVVPTLFTIKRHKCSLSNWMVRVCTQRWMIIWLFLTLISESIKWYLWVIRFLCRNNEIFSEKSRFNYINHIQKYSEMGSLVSWRHATML